MGLMQDPDEAGTELRALFDRARDARSNSGAAVAGVIVAAERRRRSRRLAAAGAGLACLGLVVAGGAAAQQVLLDRPGPITRAAGTSASPVAPVSSAPSRSLDDPLALGVLPGDSALPEGLTRAFRPMVAPAETALWSICNQPADQRPEALVFDQLTGGARSMDVWVQQFPDAATASAFADGPARGRACTASMAATFSVVPGEQSAWTWSSVPDPTIPQPTSRAAGALLVAGRSVIAAGGLGDGGPEQALRVVHGIRDRLAGSAPLTPEGQLAGSQEATETGIPYAVMVALPGMPITPPMGGVNQPRPDVSWFQGCDVPGGVGDPAKANALKAIDNVSYFASSDLNSETPDTIDIVANRYPAGQGEAAWQQLLANTGGCIWWPRAPQTQPWGDRQGLVLSDPSRHLTGAVVRVGDFIVSFTSNSPDFGPQGAAQQQAIDTVIDRLRAAGLVN